MSDSGSSIGETRMLERRISNNRADLNGDQQMNHFLAWFNTWSDLQKSDFLPVLANKMNKTSQVNGLAEDFKSLDCQSNGRPPSLFACQLKLFNDWFSGWSDDQKNYLTLRLKDIDDTFYKKYEDKVENPHDDGPKDYFEPGIPPELVQSPTVTTDKEEIVNGKNHEDEEDAKKDATNEDSSHLATISEDK